MAGQRLPIEVVQARGSKHLTKAEIQERKEREIKPVTDDIIAPDYLTKKQKDILINAGNNSQLNFIIQLIHFLADFYNDFSITE